MEWSEEYGNVARCFLGNKVFVFLTHPDDAEIILNSHVHIDKSYEYRFFKPWLGEGLLISSGDKWRSHRKLIAPAFHMNVLKTFMNIFHQNSLMVVDKLQKEVGKVFDVHDYMSEATVDILLGKSFEFLKEARKLKPNYPSQKPLWEPNDMNGKMLATTMQWRSWSKKIRRGSIAHPSNRFYTFRMCDIIHQRHYKFYYRWDFSFNLTSSKGAQKKLLEIIHGLTRSVIKTKKSIFEKNIRSGNIPSPSLAEIIREEEPMEMMPDTPKLGLRDDLDDIDENDVGEFDRQA